MSGNELPSGEILQTWKLPSGEILQTWTMGFKEPIKSKMGFYVYYWWSGSCIEQQHCKIIKITKDKIYFYNDYCQENQEVLLKFCEKLGDYGYLDRTQLIL